MKKNKLPVLSSSTSSITNTSCMHTFINDTSDPRISKILQQHGWEQVSQKNQNFSLKWSWKVQNKDFDHLDHTQMFNHYKNSQDLTTKMGLMNNFRKNVIIDDDGNNYSKYFPRSYNLHTQKDQFIEDFLKTGILNLLKKIITCLQIYYPEQYTHLQQLPSTIPNTHQYLINLLAKEKIFTKNNRKSKKFMIDQNNFIRLLIYLENYVSLDVICPISYKQKKMLLLYSQQDIPYYQPNSNHHQRYSQQFTDQTDLSKKGQLATPSTKSLILLLKYYKICCRDNKFFVDGFSNIWIIKSNHSSRGRGIKLIDSLEVLQQNNNGMKMIQKYIENIWILHEQQISHCQQILKKHKYIQKIINKKFDIRLWVYVKSASPLVIYIYDEGYLRITSENYQLDQLNRKNIHLTNYKMNWNHQTNKYQSYLLLSSFLNFLKDTYDVDINKIRQKINNIVVNTIKAADLVGPSGCFQLFGFDIILDAQMQPWLLECNMSPACSERGQLSQIFRQMMEGMFSLQGIIKSDIYGWKQIYKQQSNKNMRNSLLNRADSLKYNQLMSKTNMNIGCISQLKNRLNILGKKVNIKQSFLLQTFHYSVDQIIKIQRFMRKKFNLIYSPIQAQQIPIQAQQIPIQAQQIPFQGQQIPIQAQQIPIYNKHNSLQESKIHAQLNIQMRIREKQSKILKRKQSKYTIKKVHNSHKTKTQKQ